MRGRLEGARASWRGPKRASTFRMTVVVAALNLQMQLWASWNWSSADQHSAVSESRPADEPHDRRALATPRWLSSAALQDSLGPYYWVDRARQRWSFGCRAARGGLVRAHARSRVNTRHASPAAHAGSAAGILSTVQQIGNASGVAVIGATYFGLAASHSMRTAVIVCLASLIAALSLLALLLPRGRKPSAF